MGSAASVLLVAAGIAKSYRRRVVLDGAGLSLGAGEAVAIVGENGAGKSTLLRICAGLTSPDAGTVRVAGPIGYCPQDPGVFELLTADEHLVLFGSAMGIRRPEALRRGRELLEEFGYPDHEPTVTRDLSGGTRQKLNLALALLGDPPILLLDEPYQGFDRGTYVSFWDHVDRWRSEGKAVAIVTHMLAELSRVDRAVELRVHPSRTRRADA
jgi:ABC-2 type transport system ATP-binding protein